LRCFGRGHVRRIAWQSIGGLVPEWDRSIGGEGPSLSGLSALFVRRKNPSIGACRKHV